ncbi:MAG TPA: tetratricopeptide repeat protein [Trebonia sp.]|nr:tetratricopeptide repeat protein [Trebonia sp.]
MSELSLALLGPPVVKRDGAPVSFDTRKAIALLALLAVTGREHTREQVADLLWPDADEAKARGSLRRTLSVAAAAVGPALAITRTTVGLLPAAVDVDVREFETLLTRKDAAALERGVGLYRGDFLAGFTVRDCPDFEDWQVSVREEQKQLLARGLQRLVAACVAAGELERAIGHARRWLQLDQLHEPAHQAMIRLYEWTGQRSAAMRQYRSLVHVLDRDLAVRPLPETTQLYEDVRAGRLAAPPLPTAAAAAGPAAGTADQVAALDWPLVGRAAELSALRSAWRSAGALGAPGAPGAPGVDGARGRAVAIVGQAGSGKSRLVEELRAEAVGAGSTVLVARCHDGESALPFVLAADLLRSALNVCPELPDLLPAQTIAMAGRLVPGLADVQQDPRSPALDSPAAVARMYAAIADTLRVAAGTPAQGGNRQGGNGQRRPAGVIAVEDVHWADNSSLGLLSYLVRRLAGWPLLLALTWQPEQAGRLRVLRAAFGEAGPLGEMIEPGPLGPDAIRSLLSLPGTPPVDVDLLLAETHGLPMLVREYVEALRSAEVPGAPADGRQALLADWWPPASVRELFLARLRAASEPTLQVLTAAAVLGSDADADLLQAVSGRGEDEIVEAIEEAVARSLLTENPPPAVGGAPSYRFRYEAMRKTAYDSASLARRRLLHGRAADVLAPRHQRDPVGTPAGTVAEHLQLAGRDGAAAEWWWLAAARARELYAHAEARGYLARALALGYPQLPGRIALGEELVVLGRYREALAEFETAAAIASGQQGGDRAALAGIEHKLADVHHRLGDWDLAEAHLATVAELADDPGHLARAAADRAVVAFRRGDTIQAELLGQAALDSARAAADLGAMAQALNVLGMLAARAGDTNAAEKYLRDSLAEARRLPELGAAVAALNNLARLLAETGHGTEALALATEALELGSELGDQHRVAALHTNLADLLHAAGQREAAVTHLKEAARRFAAVDADDHPRPEIWMLVEW